MSSFLYLKAAQQLCLVYTFFCLQFLHRMVQKLISFHFLFKKYNTPQFEYSRTEVALGFVFIMGT